MIMGVGQPRRAARARARRAAQRLTVPELEELVYQAATYLGYVSGKSIRSTIAEALREPDVTA